MRDCHFLPKWKNEFPWVNHEDDTDLMFCDICRQYPLLADKTPAFYVGTQEWGIFRAIKRAQIMKGASMNMYKVRKKKRQNPRVKFTRALWIYKERKLMKWINRKL